MTAADGWRCLRVVLAARSPIHIGWHDLGFVQRTRYYIPARNLWGVLVAGLAARLTPPSGADVYRQAKNAFRESLRVTYFFPCLDGDSPLLPSFREGEGLMLGTMREADFERRFLASQTAAALDASCLTALEGALHESEYLAQQGRDGAGRLRFVGYVLARQSFPDGLVTSVLSDCRVGADRRYGWGRLTLDGEIKEESGPIFGAFTVSEWQAGSDPRIAASGKIRLPAHVRYDGPGVFEGELEPLSGRDWSVEKERQGSGQSLVRAALCWAPGTNSVGNGESPEWEFEIEAEGIWKLRSHER